MVEGIFVTLDHRAHKLGMAKFDRLAKLGLIRSTGTQLGKAVFFSKLIIITALLPIFSFEKVEGKMFSPLAWTLGFALLGALDFYTHAGAGAVFDPAQQERAGKEQSDC